MTSNSKFNFQNSKFPAGLLLALIIPVFAAMPLLTHRGLPNTADGPVHLMRQVELNQAWQEGNYYPRWGTDLALGHGMPIFSYAPPLLYQLTQLIHLTGLPLDASMKGVVVLDFLLYSVGMFLFARRVYGTAPALVAAAVYVYTPYRLREAYIQGNYGQFTGLAFYPLIFWAFHALITGPQTKRRYLLAAALSLAGLLLSHNISTMLFAPILGAYVVFLTFWGIGIRKWGMGNIKIPNRILRAITAGLLGLGLSAIFWLPAFGEKGYIKLEGITRGFFDFRHNFISLREFLSPPAPLDLTAINPEFPLSLGLPQLIAAGIAILGLIVVAILRSKSPIPLRSASGTIVSQSPTSNPKSPIPLRFASGTIVPNPPSPISHSLFFALFLLLYAFLALPYSQPVWEAIPLLELTEFPWRMLGPAIFCASVLAAPAFQYVSRIPHPASRNTLFLAIALLLPIALNLYYLYPSQFIPWGTPTPADAFAYEAASGAIGTTSTGEFLPRAAQQHPRPDTLWPDYKAGRPPQKLDPAALPPGATVTILSHRAESDTLQIDTPEPFVATLRTLYWPGWQVYLDGQPIPFTVTSNTGLIQVSIPAGRHILTLQLESTPLRSAGKWTTIISAIILLGIGLSALLLPSPNLQSPNPTPLRFGDNCLPIPQSPIPPRSASRTTVSNPTLLRFGDNSLQSLLLAGLLIAAYILTRPLEPLFVLRSDPDHPQPADRVLQVDFGDQVRLVGMDDLPQSIRLDGQRAAKMTAVVYWRVLQEIDANYAVFLHLDRPDGQTVATVDERHPENIPTRNWPPGLYLRNPLQLDIPGDLPPIRYNVTVGVYNPDTGQRLPVVGQNSDTYTLGVVWLTAPSPDLPGGDAARFGPHIRLRQASYAAADHTLTLYWQTDAAIEGNYTMFIHLLDVAGNILAQTDGTPYDGLYPPANWLPDQVVTDVRLLPTADTPLAAIAIGVYDPATGQRLPAADSNGVSLPNNSYTLRVSDE